MSDNHDTTYVPADAVLASVGLTAKKTDEAWYNVIRTNVRKNTEMEAQNAVAAYTLSKRGHADETIATTVGVSVRTVKYWFVQGQAILRTANAQSDNALARTLSACRVGSGATQALVDAATKITGSDDEKLEKLETLALTKHIQKSFVTDEGKALSDEVAASIVTSLPEQAQANLGTDNAPSAQDMLDALPNVTEAFGIQKKVASRDSDKDGGTAPKQLEYHLNLALKDMRAIAKAAEADYVPTAHDYAALFRLCDAIGVDLVMDPDVTEAVASLVQV